MSTPPSWIGLPTRLGLETEQWEQHAWQLLCDLRVACPGIVKGWDLTTYPQTVQVQLAVMENVNVDLVTTPTAIPIITVPFQVVRSGGYLLTMPIHVGDECLVIFTDNNARAWWQNGGIQKQITRRRHSINDGFAILGIYSQPRNITNYSTTTAQLRTEDGEGYIELTAGHVVNVVAPGGCNITGNTVITGNLTVSENATIDGSATVDGSLSAASTSGATATMGGDVSVTGTVNSSGEVTGNGITLSSHVHPGVSTGSGTTGTPEG